MLSENYHSIEILNGTRLGICNVVETDLPAEVKSRFLIPNFSISFMSFGRQIPFTQCNPPFSLKCFDDSKYEPMLHHSRTSTEVSR